MKNIQQIKRESEVIDKILSIIAEGEDVPLDFKIMKENRNADKLFKEIMTNKKFLNLSNESEEKRALYNFLKQEVSFLEDLKEKMNS